MNSREFQEHLSQRARLAGLEIPSSLGIQLETYYRLLATWNRKINLTGIDLSELGPHALDRLLVEPVLAAKQAASGVRVMDVGSGGGSPAIPFAMAVSARSLLMVESKTRKSAFLREAIRVLGLTNAEVSTSRVESLLSEPALKDAHDVLTMRAVRVETPLLAAMQAFLAPGGRVFLFRSVEEVPVAPPPQLTHASNVPLIESLQSQLLIFRKLHTDEDVPRETS